MTRDLARLYQEVILDHNKNPRHFGELENLTHVAHGHNPLCGDDYFVYLRKNGDVIEDIMFKGDGCAISKASASMMSVAVTGKTETEAKNLIACFIELITQDSCSDDCKTRLGRLTILEGVKQFPVRVKCAALAWRALEAALQKGEVNTKISTET